MLQALEGRAADRGHALRLEGVQQVRAAGVQCRREPRHDTGDQHESYNFV